MLRYGYDRQLATGVIMASGTLAQIIPPSLVLIVLADVLGKSVGDFYQGAIIPGLLLTALYALYVFVLTLIRPNAAPPLPPEARTLGAGVTSLFVMIGLSILVGIAATYAFKPIVEQAPEVYGSSVAVVFALLVAIANKRFELKWLSYLATRVIMVLVPPLALIFLVLGTIFIGLATPTEGGAMGAIGALVLAALPQRRGGAPPRSSPTPASRRSEAGPGSTLCHLALRLLAQQFPKQLTSRWVHRHLRCPMCQESWWAVWYKVLAWQVVLWSPASLALPFTSAKTSLPQAAALLLPFLTQH
jgi:TRAP-type C4-dicarboxylate transport system permease large subunit